LPASSKRPAARSRRESAAARAARTQEIIARLKSEFPDAGTALHHRNPYELLVATILSAQCTDKRVNMVTPQVFARYPDARALAMADQTELEELVRSTGFFRNKAKNLIACARSIVEHHGGQVPDSMEALVALGGVGRKTANVVLGNAFGKDEGVVVDTHVQRISGLLALTSHTDPVRIEEDLMKVVPRHEWTLFPHLLILHGRATCVARRPRCTTCVIAELCPGRTKAM
jgi:endonuclease III